MSSHLTIKLSILTEEYKRAELIASPPVERRPARQVEHRLVRQKAITGDRSCPDPLFHMDPKRATSIIPNEGDWLPHAPPSRRLRVARMSGTLLRDYGNRADTTAPFPLPARSL
jgi:hypothetical protein